MLGAIFEAAVGTLLVIIPDPVTTAIGAGMIADGCRRIADQD